MKLKVTVNKIPYEVEVDVDDNPQPMPVVLIGATPPPPRKVTGISVKAPLAGSIRKILVEPGQVVKAGEVVAVLEAMKMETEITTTYPGKVAGIVAKVGDAVQGGDPIIDIDPQD